MAIFKQIINTKDIVLSLRVVLVFCFVSFFSEAQQDPAYTQYSYNLSVVNPAYVASKDYFSLGFLGRSQWIGINGAPTTYSFFGHIPINKGLKTSASLIFDKTGPINETNFYSDIAYSISISENLKLGLGIKLGLTSRNVDLLSLTQLQQEDPLFAKNTQNTFFNFGSGLFLYTDNTYFGISVPNFLESLYYKGENGVITNASEEIHLFATGGTIINLDENFKFKPSFLTRLGNNSPLSVDLSANFLFKEKVEFGASFRVGSSISGLINFRVAENLRIGYSYDHVTSTLRHFTSGTHEVMFLFDFLKSNKNSSKNYKSPRFF